MHRTVILFCIAATISASPMIPLDSTPQDDSVLISPPRNLQRRNGLPPVSEVLLALQMQSLLPNAFTSPTEILNSGNLEAAPTSSPTLAVTTLPYTGPGILVLPESLGQVTSTGASSAKSASAQAKAPNHKSNTTRHLAIIGGAFGVILFFVACGFFLMDPRIWKACSRPRKEQMRRDHIKGYKKETSPECMRSTPNRTSGDKSFEKKRVPTLSIFPYNLPDGLKSKFSMTTASEYSCADDCSFGGTVSSPQFPVLSFNGHGRPLVLSPPLSTFSPGPNRKIRTITPSRPPRPPTTDSPAAIDSIYYADVDDPGFYRHPNPIALQPTSSISINPPPKASTNALPHSNILSPTRQSFSSITLCTDTSQRRNRSQSAPAFDALPTTRGRFSGATTITQDTLESTGSDSECSHQKLHRKSTSAVSWIRYSEFQRQHHLRLQQDKLGEQPSSCTSPTRERNTIGSAY